MTNLSVSNHSGCLFSSYASSAGSTNTSWFRSITGIDFINRTVICVFALAEKLANFAHAAFTQGKSLSSEILSLLVFVERRHKRLLGAVSASGGVFRNHLKYRRNIFKVTNFFQFCKFTHLIINYLTVFFGLFGRC